MQLQLILHNQLLCLYLHIFEGRTEHCKVNRVIRKELLSIAMACMNVDWQAGKNMALEWEETWGMEKEGEQRSKGEWRREHSEMTFQSSCRLHWTCWDL